MELFWWHVQPRKDLKNSTFFFLEETQHPELSCTVKTSFEVTTKILQYNFDPMNFIGI